MTYGMLCTSSPEKAYGFIKEWASRASGGVFEVLCTGFNVIARHRSNYNVVFVWYFIRHCEASQKPWQSVK